MHTLAERIRRQEPLGSGAPDSSLWLELGDLNYIVNFGESSAK